MKVAVLGGSGFLGSHVADELSKKGHNVKIFDKKKSKWKRSDQKMYVGDIQNSKDVEVIIKNADVVFHFAALADLDQALNDPINTVKINVLSTVQVLELCLKYNIKRFIYASTIYVNSVDGGFYRSSKKAAEDYIVEYNKIFGLNYTILRFGSLYGQRSDDTNGIRKILKNAIFNENISYSGSQQAVRRYINVLDAAIACVNTLRAKYNNKHINITGNKKIKVEQFLKSLSKILKISKKVKFLNQKTTGHYNITPFTFKPKKGQNFKYKPSVNFYEEILKLVKEIKNEKRFKNFN